MIRTKFVTRLTLGAGLLCGLAISASAETLKIGIIAPLTGPAAVWGKAVEMGTKIAADEVNAKGGLEVGGKKYDVQVIAYDDQYKAAEAVAAYNRLYNTDHAKLMVSFGTAATLALRDNFQNDKVIALTGSGASNAIRPNDKYLVRVYSVMPNSVPSFVDWVKNNFSERRLAIINPNDESGWEGDKISSKHYEAAGFQIVAHELYERSQKDFAPLITKILSTNPEIIELCTSSPATAGLFVRQARELGYKGKFVKDTGPAPVDIIEAAGKENAEGLVNIIYADPGTAGYKRVAAEYKRVVGQEPNGMLLSFYDATNVMLRAVQKAGEVNDADKIRAAFAQVLPMNSVMGDPMNYGGKPIYGADNQILTYSYIAVDRDGVPVVVAKLPQ